LVRIMVDAELAALGSRASGALKMVVAEAQS
jgi:hypothetical protein